MQLSNMPSPPAVVFQSTPNPNGLQKCLPFLMPFHIGYSGQAPISTYLHISAAKESIGAPTEVEHESNDPLTDVEMTELNSSENAGTELNSAPTENVVNPTSPSLPASSSTLLGRVKGGATRFISSFRGRKIQGLNVALPDGYSGFVLRAGSGEAGVRGKEDYRDSKQAMNGRFSKLASRITRRRRGNLNDQGVMVIEISDDDGLLSEDDPLPLDEEENLRTLTISSKFSSFVLWHPDHPVDEGKDEYTRSLSEWTQLARLVHQAEA